jgi:hypothetical protein
MDGSRILSERCGGVVYVSRPGRLVARPHPDLLLMTHGQPTTFDGHLWCGIHSRWMAEV